MSHSSETEAAEADGDDLLATVLSSTVDDTTAFLLVQKKVWFTQILYIVEKIEDVQSKKKRFFLYAEEPVALEAVAMEAES